MHAVSPYDAPPPAVAPVPEAPAPRVVPAVQDPPGRQLVDKAVGRGQRQLRDVRYLGDRQGASGAEATDDRNHLAGDAPARLRALRSDGAAMADEEAVAYAHAAIGRVVAELEP